MEIIKQLFYGSSVSSSMESLILVSSILSTTDLAFSSHKYAWLGTDQILIFFLDKMVVAKLFLFSQVTSYRMIYVYPLVSFIYCHIYIYNLIKSNFPLFFILLTGVTILSILQNPNNSIQPDFYTNKISDFLALKAATVIFI